MFQHTDQHHIQFPRFITEGFDSAEVSPTQILDTVSEYFDINKPALKSRRKSESLRIPRQIAIYLCLQGTRLSYHDIGQFFAGRHSSTIRHHCMEMQNTLRENVFTRTIVTDISRKIFR